MDINDAAPDDPVLPYLNRIVAILDEATTQGNDDLGGSVLLSALCTAGMRLAMGGADLNVVRKSLVEAIDEGLRKIGAGETRQ
jgi:hypothetical protein